MSLSFNEINDDQPITCDVRIADRWSRWIDRSDLELIVDRLTNDRRTTFFNTEIAGVIYSDEIYSEECDGDGLLVEERDDEQQPSSVSQTPLDDLLPSYGTTWAPEEGEDEELTDHLTEVGIHTSDWQSTGEDEPEGSRKLVIVGTRTEVERTLTVLRKISDESHWKIMQTEFVVERNRQTGQN